MTPENEPSKLRTDPDAPVELVASEPVELPQGFAFVSLLGEGATSFVVKARHLLTERDSAIKIMKGESHLNEVATERFKREAQVLASLDHKHIHKILGFGLTPKNSHPYIVSEFLEGQALDQKLKTQNVLPASDFKTIFLQLAQALEYLHAAGIIHRDIKPSNIFLSKNVDGELSAKFIDFGLAKILEDGEGATADQKLTRTGTIMGSPSYMSPEQCAGKPADERSDFYSLACVMYECLSGSPPLDGAGPMDTMYRHMMEEPEPLNRLRGKEQAEPLEALVMRMLAKDPAARPQKAGELLAELSQSMTGKHFEKMLRSAPTRTSKRMPAWMFVAGSLLVILCGAAAMKAVLHKRSTKAVPVQMKAQDAWQQIREAYKCSSDSLEKPNQEALKLLNQGESVAGQALGFEKAQPHPRLEILYCANYMLGMLLSEKARRLKDGSMLERALNRFSDAANAAMQPSGEAYPETGGAQMQMGEIYLKKGRVNEATHSFREACNLLSEKNMKRAGQKHLHLDPYSPGKLTFHDLPRAEYRAGCCYWQSGYEEAGEQFHRLAIRDYNAGGCMAEQDVMECWSNIFEHYANTGRPAKAREELAAIDKALVDFERTTPLQTKVLAAANLTVARHCLAIKDDVAFNRTEENIKHVLEAARLIDLAEPGMMRSSAAATFLNAAALCRKEGRTKDAETLEKRAAELTAYKD